MRILKSSSGDKLFTIAITERGIGTSASTFHPASGTAIADSAQGLSESEKLCSDEEMHEKRQAERRRTRRVRMKQGMRVRPTSPKDGPFEEVGTTTNVSQDGVYFVTKKDVYREGMRLYVTVPYHSPFSPQNYEYLGQVARIEAMADGKKGIAVRFLSSTKKPGAATWELG
jgi:PilZ domain